MKIFKLLIASTIMITMLSSCLKNKIDTINPDKSPSVVEFKNPVSPASETPEGSLYTVYPVAYETSPSTEVSYVIQLSGPNPAPQDITVNIGVKSSAVTALNDEKKVIASYVPYVELPAALYTINTPTVTIPAGQSTAIVKVAYKFTNFDFTKKYALPISIISTSYANVSGNFGTILLNVKGKNAWDGIYSMGVGSFVQRYTSPGVPSVNDALNGSIEKNSDVTLTTIDNTTVEISGLKWAGNSSSVAGIDNLQAVIDPATNLVTMKSLGNTTLKNIPGKDNKYDPATKTFTLNFDWGQATSPRVMGLVIKYKASR